MEKLLFSFMYNNGIHDVDKDDVYLQLTSHSDYPSIHAITDTLDYFGIENLAAQIPKESLSEIPKTFLAIIEKNDQKEIVSIVRKRKYILLKDQENKKRKLGLDDFIKEWTGIIIAINVETNASTNNSRFSLDIALITLVLVISVFLLYMQMDFKGLLYVLLSMIGSGISYFIAKEDLGIYDPVAKKICTSITSDAQGCQAVVTAEESKIIKDITLGDLSLIYFTSVVITLVFLNVPLESYFVCTLLSVLIVLYTLYVQYMVLKKWCFLCLLISGVLMAQFSFQLSVFEYWSFSIPYFLKIGGIFFLMLLGWRILKRFWKRTIKLEHTRTAYYKFKRHKEFFFSALHREQTDYEPISEKHTLLFGDPNASIQLTAVTNPFCGFCSKTFLSYDKLLKIYPEDVNLKIVFGVPMDHTNPAYKIAFTVCELYQNDSLKSYEALHTWYTHKNTDTWFQEYIYNDNTSIEVIDIITAHRKWCSANKINYTPETIMYGKKFPSELYQIDDLSFFIEDLKDMHEESEAA